MAVRPRRTTSTRQSGNRLGVALFACLLVANTAIAATPHKILCSESDDPTLQVSVDQLSNALSESHNVVTADYSEQPAEDDAIVVRKAVLEPRAKAAIREAFQEISDDSASESSTAESVEDDELEESPKPRAMNTKLPGISEERMDRFKRQMYRRDI